PALIELGVPAIVAHLSIFWFSQLSTITPPVCMTAFAAAAIAKAPEMRTGFAAFKTGFTLYVVPMIFLFSTILNDNWITVMIIGIVSIAAMHFFSSSLEGYIFVEASILIRILSFVVFLLLFASTFNNVILLQESLIILILDANIESSIWLYHKKRKVISHF